MNDKKYWESLVGHEIEPKDPKLVLDNSKDLIGNEFEPIDPKISERVDYKIEHDIKPFYITETPEMLGEYYKYDSKVTHQGCNVNYPEDPNDIQK
jgi:hypothetical protein